MSDAPDLGNAPSRFERFARAIPGGTFGSWVMPERETVSIESGSGVYVRDVNGREYLDFVLGSGPLPLGHAHPAVVAAIHEQAARGTHYYTMNPPALELAERIIDWVPSAESVKYTSTGAEATFQAMRIARAVTGREKILKFVGSYHGHHDYGQVGSSAGIPEAIRDLVLLANYNDPDSVAQVFEEHADEMAAVIVEPIQRITSPRPGFLSFLRDITSRYGTVLIFDEVVTGFRVARGGVQELCGVTPDLSTFGKALGGGMPIAVVAGRADLMAYANPRRTEKKVFFSGTMNGNPLGAAAGLATLKVLDEGGYEALESSGAELREGLRAVAASSPVPLQIVGEGSMAGLIFAEGDVFDPATAARSDKALATALDSALLEEGILTNLTAKFYTSTVHTSSEIARVCEVLGNKLAALAK